MPTPFAIKVFFTGVQEQTGKLELLSEKFTYPLGGLNRIAELFSLMEFERFTHMGRATQFGIYQEWEPIADKTQADRQSLGGNKGPQPLFVFGYLARAATMPKYEEFAGKAISLAINPVDQGAPAKYSHGRNYGVFAQNGRGTNPKRQFVTITPEFRAEAVAAMTEWLREPEMTTSSGMKQREIITTGSYGQRQRRIKRMFADASRAEKHAGLRLESQHDHVDFGTWIHNDKAQPRGVFKGNNPAEHNANLDAAHAAQQNPGAKLTAAERAQHQAYLKAEVAFHDTPVHLLRR